MLFFDFVAHNTIGNPETLGYYLAKPLIAGYIAYIYYKNKSTLYVYAATIFAFLHGTYYRVIELFTGNPLFSRVGDVHIGTITFRADTIWQGITAWAFIHGGAFLISIFVVEYFAKKGVL